LREGSADPRSPTAQKICRATMSVAHALDLAPIAAGIDHQLQRDALLEMGCRYGSGDYFADDMTIVREAF
jgi:EAL domain-containing protein (putative c-di-GMP-specific phosphodiesterase class I)